MLLDEAGCDSNIKDNYLDAGNAPATYVWRMGNGTMPRHTPFVPCVPLVKHQATIRAVRARRSPHFTLQQNLPGRPLYFGDPPPPPPSPAIGG